jgi:hypothetical protein
MEDVMTSRNERAPWSLVALASVAGALVAALLGVLTFGAQATAAPHGVPVAVSAPDSGPARTAAEHVAAQGGGPLAWRVTTPAEARNLLEDKKIYGILDLAPGQGVSVVVSGAVNPSGTQLVQQALTGAGQALSSALGSAAPVKVETVHPVSTAGRTAPLALSAVAWLGCLVAGAALTALAGRSGRRPGAGARLVQVAGTAVLVTGVLAGFLKLWDDTLPLSREVLGFAALTATAFAAVQTGLLRLLGIRAMALLAPLYLLAPAVAGQVPELLHPAYRTLLWSWTPFRFSSEGLRSLLAGTPHAPDVASGVWVLGGMLVAGLVVVLWPGRSAREEAEPHSPDRVVEVGVH